MEESGERRVGDLASAPTSCADCSNLRRDDSWCAVRGDEIPEPRRGVCANHSDYGAGDRFPIGPVVLREDGGPRMLYRSPYSRQVCDKLLHVLEDADALRWQDLTVRESVALWQLRQFEDSRAHRFVDGLEGIPPSLGALPDALVTVPAPDEPESLDEGRVAVGEFAAASGRAKVVVCLLVLWILASIGLVASGEAQVGLLRDAENGLFDPADAEAHDRRHALIGSVELLLYLLTGIVFLVWFRAVHKNLRPLGATGLRYSPGWALGGWFVPILNLVRPYQVMEEVWVKSSKVLPRGIALLVCWWTAWLAMIVSNQVATMLARGPGNIGDLVAATRAEQIAQLVGIAAAVLAILVVRGVDARQNREEGLAHVFE